MKPILNISAYRFVTLDRLPTLQVELKVKCQKLELLGTILLGEEGINLILAGETANIRAFQDYMNQDERFNDLPYKDSYSDDVPFQRLRVRIRPEIVTFGQPGLDPKNAPAPHLDAETLKQWYDEGKDFVIIDTRNDYEYELGTFENAVCLDLKNFRDFPEAMRTQTDESLKDKTVVTFCTGGIRCEKAAPYLQQQGYKDVYQLDGGILRYFEKCGGEHWQGGCFVFDERVTVEP